VDTDVGGELAASILYNYDEGSRFLQNVGTTVLPHYLLSCLKS